MWFCTFITALGMAVVQVQQPGNNVSEVCMLIVSIEKSERCPAHAGAALIIVQVVT